MDQVEFDVSLHTSFMASLSRHRTFFHVRGLHNLLAGVQGVENNVKLKVT